MKRPIGISFIGYFYIIGDVLILLTIGMEQPINFNVRFGIPAFPEHVFKIMLSAYSFILAYSYLKMYRWGYWNMALYSSIFFLISLNLTYHYEMQPFIGNAIFSIMVLSYTIKKRSCFVN